MNIRGITIVFCLAIGMGAGYAAAQQPAQQPTPVAHLTKLQGNVLVSKDDAMVAAANNAPLTMGTRVVTMKGASVSVDYGNGCVVPLKENQRFTVDKGTCSALIAGVADLGPAPGAIGGGGVAATGAASGFEPWMVVPIAIGGVGLYEVYKSTGSVSSN